MSERGYGWDEHAKDGVEELRRIRDSATLAKRKGQREILDRFVEAYSRGTEEQIEAATFYPAHKTCPDKLHKKVSKMMAGLRRSIDEYYRDDSGRRSSVRIEFASEERSLRLRVRPVPPSDAPADPVIPRHPGVVYTEVTKATFCLEPVLWAVLCLISVTLAVILGIDSLMRSVMARAHWASLFGTVPLMAATVLCLMVMRTAYFVYRHNFAYFVGECFIRREGRANTVALYTAACPLCPKLGRGQVRLTYHRQKRGGYRAECGKNRDLHRFSFDHTTLTGERIPV